MRFPVVLMLICAPGLAGAECLTGERSALFCALAQGGQMSLCWTAEQARLVYDERPGNPAKASVPLGDVTGQTANDWASSTLLGDGVSYEIYLAGEVAGMNRIRNDGASSAFACAAGMANGSLAELNEAALYAASSKEK